LVGIHQEKIGTILEMEDTARGVWEKVDSTLETQMVMVMGTILDRTSTH